MTDKLVLATVSEAQANSSLMAAINSNSSAIVTAMDNTLSRDGTTPNQMLANLDMNSFAILNLPTPVSETSPVRLSDLEAAASATTLTNVTGTGKVVLQTSPALLGVPTSTTAAGGTNTTQIATTAFVQGLLASPTLTGTPTAPTATLGTNTTQLATTAFVLANAGGGGGSTSSPMVSVLAQDATIDSTGVADVHIKLQNAINTITTNNFIVYIPNGTYNLGSSSITVPTGARVVCHNSATLKRTADPTYSDYTACMVIMSNYSRWSGGILNNAYTITTSNTVNTISTGSKTFVVSAGLPIVNGQFLRIYSASAPFNQYEGTVTSYSGTSLVVNCLFSAGSGTYSDWSMNTGSVYQSPMVMHNTTGVVVESVRATGNWYVGFLMDALNVGVVTNLVVNNCTYKDCSAEGIQNRGFYIYGTSTDCKMINCTSDGLLSGGNYGFNINAANSSGTLNSTIGLKIIGCTSINNNAQGFAFGDRIFYSLISNCEARNIYNGGVGFLLAQANAATGTPQYNTISDCVAVNCTGEGYASLGAQYTTMSNCSSTLSGQGFYFGPSGGIQSTFVDCADCSAIASTTSGFHFVGNSADCSAYNLRAISNGTYGVQVDAGCTNIIVSGRSVANSTGNLNNNGTATVSTNLVQV